MPDISDWLTRYQLEHYLDAFISQDISVELLPDLDADDLRELGMSLGDRKRFLRAIANSQTDSKNPSPVDSEAERRQLTVMFVDLVGSTALHWIPKT
jgi:class 3 adenylate cyclase